MRTTWPRTTISSIRILRDARLPTGSARSDTRKNWWARTLPTAPNPPRKWCRAGLRVPATAKTSWTRDSPRWASHTLRVRRPSTVCTGFRCWRHRGCSLGPETDRLDALLGVEPADFGHHHTQNHRHIDRNELHSEPADIAIQRW